MKNKKGFTLIELLFVIAIIGILALMGLRLYLDQKDYAKNAIVKANAATVHTLIQGNLADNTYNTATQAVMSIIPHGMENPYTGIVVTSDDTVNDISSDYSGTAGTIYVVKKDDISQVFYIQGMDKNGYPLGTKFTAKK